MAGRFGEWSGWLGRVSNGQHLPADRLNEDMRGRQRQAGHEVRRPDHLLHPEERQEPDRANPGGEEHRLRVAPRATRLHA